jgi:hypothetical protein
MSQVGESMLVTYEPRRMGLRWIVVKRTAFPDGLHGVRIRPFEHPTGHRFWTYRAAMDFAVSQAWRREEST